MPMVLLLLLIAWPVAEILVIVKVAEAIGLLATIVLLIAAWPLGTWTLRSQGRAAWRRMAAAVAQGRPPAREVTDGALVVLGGGLLIIPGFITDVLGVLLLLPPTRALMRGVMLRNFQSRLLAGAVRFGATRQPSGDIDSTAADLGSTAADAESTAGDSTVADADRPRLRR